MSTNEYHFVSHWRVAGTVEQVSDVLGDPIDLVNWWPSVYLAVKEIEPGDANGVGRVVTLHTRGWLPYTLRWSFRVTENRRPYGFSLEAWGDFDGTGVWAFEPDGEDVKITYDWRIRAEKPLLRYLSFLLKPVFAANHRWAMAQGETCLRARMSQASVLSRK
jgi:hypothetical protein